MPQDGGKRKPLTLEQWAEVRAAYEAGASENELFKRYGCDRKTIRAHRKAESWVPHVTPRLGEAERVAVHARAQAQVIDLASRRAMESPQAAEIVADVAEQLVATIDADKLAATYMKSILTRASEGKIRPASGPGEQTEADVAKAVLSAYRTFTATVRENAGRRVGEPSVGTNTPLRTVFEVVVAKRETA